MIRRVRITNWRAYERLELDLEKPVTFVVAPNAVGKSSLIEAVGWATFGKTAGGRRAKLVRVGASKATVELSIELPTGHTIQLVRSLTKGGKSTFSASAEGHEISEQKYFDLLREAWAAEPNLLGALLFGEAGAHASSAFPIRDHLAEVFGIAPLMEAASVIDERSTDLQREIDDLRADESAEPRSVRAAEEKVRQLEAALKEEETRLGSAKKTAEDLGRQKRAALAWQQYREDLAAYEREASTLIETLAKVVSVDNGDPEVLVGHAEDEATSELDRLRTEISEEQTRAGTAGLALKLLDDEVAVCPTCLRPLSPGDRAHALAQHETTRGDADTQIGTWQQAIEDAERRLGQVRDIGRSLRKLRVPAAPESPDPGSEAVERGQVAEQEVVKAGELYGAAAARFEDASEELSSLKEAAAENAALVAAYREHIVLNIVKDALGSVINRYMTERIQPLTVEVSGRAKALLGSEGLRLEPDGSLGFHVGDEKLELPDLSGGERVVALFVTRLLLVASATRATTLWLDEPLEHLDPRRRAAVARTLVKAVERGALKQVIVTTYEEKLARRLALSASETVGVAHVKAARRE